MNVFKKIHFRFPKQKGFSVIEIILAAALFLIFSGGAIIVVLQGFDANRTATEMIVANQYAIEGLEAVRSIGDQSYSNLTLSSGTGLVRSASNTWTFSGTNNQFGPNNKYTRVITITAVNRDASGNIVSSGGTLDANTKKITATVTWTHTSARIDSVVQTTYLTNWGANAN